MAQPPPFPHTALIVDTLSTLWPDHARYLTQSFASRDLALLQSTERHAEIIMRIIGSPVALSAFCEDYRFLCDKLMEEEIYFRRNGRYRLSTFESALKEVYSNGEFMGRYMNFLLLSHILWDNHARAIAHFEDTYLPTLPNGTDHLEVGPGHGLLLHSASQADNVRSVAGWDVSPTSIAQTRRCMAAMGAKQAELTLQNLFDAPLSHHDRRYGSVVLAEVLEHLEDPVAALKAVSRHMRAGGMLWIHVPINSPAPDHLYLLRTPEEAVELIRKAGFEPVDHEFFPMAGQSLERARKRELTISAVISARLQT